MHGSETCTQHLQDLRPDVSTEEQKLSVKAKAQRKKKNKDEKRKMTGERLYLFCRNWPQSG